MRTLLAGRKVTQITPVFATSSAAASCCGSAKVWRFVNSTCRVRRPAGSSFRRAGPLSLFRFCFRTLRILPHGGPSRNLAEEFFHRQEGLTNFFAGGLAGRGVITQAHDRTENSATSCPTGCLTADNGRSRTSSQKAKQALPVDVM